MLDNEIISERIGTLTFRGAKNKNSGRPYSRAIVLTEEFENLGINDMDGVLITLRKDKSVILRKAFAFDELMKTAKALQKENEKIASQTETPPEPVEDDKVDNDSTSQ